MKDSNIAWCHNTFNPWRGCSGERCQLAKLGLCYADTMETARGRDFEELILTSPGYWEQPWQWEAEAAAKGVAFRISSSPCGPTLSGVGVDGRDIRNEGTDSGGEK